MFLVMNRGLPRFWRLYCIRNCVCYECVWKSQIVLTVLFFYLTYFSWTCSDLLFKRRMERMIIVVSVFMFLTYSFLCVCCWIQRDRLNVGNLQGTFVLCVCGDGGVSVWGTHMELFVFVCHAVSARVEYWHYSSNYFFYLYYYTDMMWPLRENAEVDPCGEWNYIVVVFLAFLKRCDRVGNVGNSWGNLVSLCVCFSIQGDRLNAGNLCGTPVNLCAWWCVCGDPVNVGNSCGTFVCHAYAIWLYGDRVNVGKSWGHLNNQI